MNRWPWVFICVVFGVLLLVCGLLVPAHLRAVDSRVIQLAAGQSPSFVEKGLALVDGKKLGAAELLSDAAQQHRIPEHEELRLAVTNLAKESPTLAVWGRVAPRLETLVEASLTSSNSEPFTDVAIRSENREKLLDYLAASRNPAVQQMLRFRAETNTTIFPSSQSSAGQALDAALSITGLLLQRSHLNAAMSNAVFSSALEANRGNSQPFEQALMDMMSLGQRFNWGQLVEFVSQIRDFETLHYQAGLVRKAGRQLPVLFAAVELSDEPAAVANYLMLFSESGLDDLGASLRFGSAGVRELLQRNQRLYVSGSYPHLFAGYTLRAPQFALMVKLLLYLAAGFVLAMALHFARPQVSALERPLQVRGFHIAREILFSVGFLLVVLLVSEPFLAQDNQKAEFRFQLRLPSVGGVVPAGTTGVNESFNGSYMNQTVLLTMLLFFVLQALLYVASLVKLAEIHRQQVPARMKLKLLENEDHLFDAGLYLGFLGTIISLILVSLGVFKQPSLMAAYSSTSFGILFVVLFKVVHLRTARRKLLLEAEARFPDQVEPETAHTFAAPL